MLDSLETIAELIQSSFPDSRECAKTTCYAGDPVRPSTPPYSLPFGPNFPDSCCFQYTMLSSMTGITEERSFYHSTLSRHHLLLGARVLLSCALTITLIYTIKPDIA